MQSVRQQLNTFPELISIQMDMPIVCVCSVHRVECILCSVFSLQSSTRDEATRKKKKKTLLIVRIARSNLSLSMSVFARIHATHATECRPKMDYSIELMALLRTRFICRIVDAFGHQCSIVSLLTQISRCRCVSQNYKIRYSRYLQFFLPWKHFKNSPFLKSR